MPTTPYEVLYGPLELFIAPVGEAFPALEVADPTAATNWELLGTSGQNSETEEGVTVRANQDLAYFRSAGQTAPRKAVRTSEDLEIEVMLADASIETFARALNNAAITDTAAGSGTVGHRAIDMLQGADVTEWAVLARGHSPYLDGQRAQFEVYRAVQSANVETVHRKDQPAALRFTFRALLDASGNWAVLRGADAAALP